MSIIFGFLRGDLASLPGQGQVMMWSWIIIATHGEHKSRGRVYHLDYFRIFSNYTFNLILCKFLVKYCHTIKLGPPSWNKNYQQPVILLFKQRVNIQKCNLLNMHVSKSITKYHICYNIWSFLNLKFSR